MSQNSNPRAPFCMSSDRERLAPLDGMPFIVHVVVNIEYWAYDAPTPRTIVVPPHGKYRVPDLPNFCWSEYGNRTGMPRLLEVFNDRKLPVSASINASVIDIYPELAAAVRDAGWEFVGHGLHQKSQSADNDEGSQIKAALDKLADFAGKRPRGWMSPGWSETFDTLDHLKDNDIEYVCQWVIDDLPTRLKTRNGPIVSVPYGLDLNDSVVYAIEKSSTDEMRKRMHETIKTFAYEIDRYGQPRVLTIPMHPHLSGVPHRINFVKEIVDTLGERDDTVFVNGSQLLDWFSSAAVQGEKIVS